MHPGEGGSSALQASVIDTCTGGEDRRGPSIPKRCGSAPPSLPVGPTGIRLALLLLHGPLGHSPAVRGPPPPRRRCQARGRAAVHPCSACSPAGGPCSAARWPPEARRHARSSRVRSLARRAACRLNLASAPHSFAAPGSEEGRGAARSRCRAGRSQHRSCAARSPAPVGHGARRHPCAHHPPSSRAPPATPDVAAAALARTGNRAAGADRRLPRPSRARPPRPPSHHRPPRSSRFPPAAAGSCSWPQALAPPWSPACHRGPHAAVAGAPSPPPASCRGSGGMR